jgi:hypothetical protein
VRAVAGVVIELQEKDERASESGMHPTATVVCFVEEIFATLGSKSDLLLLYWWKMYLG